MVIIHPQGSKISSVFAERSHVDLKESIVEINTLTLFTFSAVVEESTATLTVFCFISNIHVGPEICFKDDVYLIVAVGVSA